MKRQDFITVRVHRAGGAPAQVTVEAVRSGRRIVRAPQKQAGVTGGDEVLHHTPQEFLADALAFERRQQRQHDHFAGASVAKTIAHQFTLMDADVAWQLAGSDEIAP